MFVDNLVITLCITAVIFCGIGFVRSVVEYITIAIEDHIYATINMAVTKSASGVTAEEVLATILEKRLLDKATKERILTAMTVYSDARLAEVRDSMNKETLQ